MTLQKKNFRALTMLLLVAVMVFVRTANNVSVASKVRLNITSKTLTVGEKVQVKVVESNMENK